MERKDNIVWFNFATKAISAVLIAMSLYLFSGWADAANAADAAVQAQIDEAEREASRGPYSAADGRYEGVAQGYGGDVVIAVTIENGYISSLEAVSYEFEDQQWWDLAKSLLDTIPAEQSFDVDVVSTATYSSVGIINAAKAAVLSAPDAE